MYCVNTLRLTFEQHLTDDEMYNWFDVLCNELKIAEKADYYTLSPIEQPDTDTDNRHIHVHWVGDPLSVRTKENVMKHFRDNGGPLFKGNKGSHYETRVVSDLEEVRKVLRYPLKTGTGPFRDNRSCPYFDFDEQMSLAKLEYQARLEHEKQKIAREEAHKHSHGINLYNLAHQRHKQEQFTSMNELLRYLVVTSIEDPGTVTISKSRIADIANKLSLEFQIVTVDEFVESIMRKHF